MAFNMKNIILLLVFHCSFSVYSQGNLQFNRALFLQMEINYLGSTSSTPILVNNLQSFLFDSIVLNVPVGKVVKVERINANVKKIYIPYCTPSNTTAFELVDTLGTEVNSYVTRPYVFINGIFAYALGVDNFPNNESPIWLPNGTYVFTLKGRSQESFMCGDYYRSPVCYKAFISAIEFNLIP